MLWSRYESVARLLFWRATAFASFAATIGEVFLPLLFNEFDERERNDQQQLKFYVPAETDVQHVVIMKPRNEVHRNIQGIEFSEEYENDDGDDHDYPIGYKCFYDLLRNVGSFRVFFADIGFVKTVSRTEEEQGKTDPSGYSEYYVRAFCKRHPVFKIIASEKVMDHQKDQCDRFEMFGMFRCDVCAFGRFLSAHSISPSSFVL